MDSSIVLIGHGYWGKNIARNLNEMGCLHGICESDTEAHPALREKYPEAVLYKSPDEIWLDDRVEGVAISTPAESHAVLAIAAMENGRDVFVEKPLALSVEDGQKMVHIANKTGRILMVGHLLEYHPVVKVLDEMVKAGELGKLQYLYSSRLNLGKFRGEENILWSFAPHDISVILRLVGESPLEIMATGGAYLQPNNADITVSNMLFDNGIRAHIFVSWLHPFKEQRLVVIGSKKMAVFDDREVPEKKLLVIDKGADWVDNRPIPRSGDGVYIEYEQGEPLRLEMEHFVTCIRTRQQPITDGHNGLRVLQALHAGQQSLQMGGSRVPFFQASSGVSYIK